MRSETPSPRTLNRALLARQMLLTRQPMETLEAVARMCALQAQEPRHPFVGLWSRLRRFEREHLAALLRNGHVVRATSLRATLHYLTAADFARWRPALQPMLSAAARAVLGERTSTFSLDAVTAAAREYLRQPRTFEDVRQHLIAQFPQGDERAMGYAVRLHLPLIAVPDESEWCFRPDPRFVLANEFDSNDARPELVRRYLAAYGPAGVADIQAWSGMSNLQTVVDALGDELLILGDGRKKKLYDLPSAPRPDAETPAPVRFLPDFDSILLAHADRTRIIFEEHRKLVATRNLRILPTFLVDGFVAGTWKLTVTKTATTLAVSSFGKLSKHLRNELAEEGERLAAFIAPGVKRRELQFD